MPQTISVPIDKGWMPDNIPFAMPLGGLFEAKNVLPYDEGYFLMLGPQSYSSGVVTGVPYNALEEKNDADDIYYPFVGTSTQLFRMETNKAITNISKAGVPDYGASPSGWSFSRYKTWLIATNYLYAPQVLKGLTAANFVDLGGSPPKAEYCITYYNHLIFAYTNVGGTLNGKRVQWSALDDPESWTASLTTGAGSQSLDDAEGFITGMAIMGNTLVIGHKNSVTLGRYARAPFTFEFDTNVLRNIGPIENTMVSVGNALFFWDEREIFMFDGQTATPIGAGVRNKLLTSVNYNFLHRITTAHDPERGIVFWGYPSTLSTLGYIDKIAAFNYRKGRWTHIDIECAALFIRRKGGYTMDSMDTDYPILDNVSTPLDANFWSSKYPVLSCVNTSTLKLDTFTGTAMTGTLETGEISNKNEILMVSSVRPKTHGLSSNNVTDVRVGTRFNEDDPVTFSTSATVGANGKADMRASGRFARVELTTGSNSGIASIDIDVTSRGGR